MKSMLGTMMVRAGLLAESQVAAANAMAGERGVRFVEAVLEHGLADEDAIVAFVQSKLMIPRVREAVLARVQPEPIALVPARLAWEHDVLPVSLDQTGNLTIAMADPTDVKAVNAIAAHTHAYLVRAVAPLSALRQALTQHYGSREIAMAAPLPQPPAQPPAAVTAPAPVASSPAPAATRAPPVSRGAGPSIPPGPTAPSAPRVPSSSPLPPPPAAALDHDPSSHQPLESLGVPDHTDDSPSKRVIDPEDDPTPNPYSQGPYSQGNYARAPAVHSPVRPRAPVQHSNALPPPPTAAPSHVPTTRTPSGIHQEGAIPDAIARSRSRTPAAGGSKSWNPPLTDASAEPIPLSPEAFEAVLPRVAEAQDRDDLTRVLLDFLASGFQRVLLFVHSRGELRGHDSRGSDLLPEAVKQVRLPAAGPSVFSKVIERQQPYFGPMPRTEQLDVAFAEALGGVKGNVLVLPVLLGNMVPLLVFAQNTRHAVDPFSVRDLSDSVANALTRIIATKRSN